MNIFYLSVLCVCFVHVPPSREEPELGLFYISCVISRVLRTQCVCVCVCVVLCVCVCVRGVQVQ